MLARLPQVRRISVPSTLVFPTCHDPSRSPRAPCPLKKMKELQGTQDFHDHQPAQRTPQGGGLSVRLAEQSPLAPGASASATTDRIPGDSGDELIRFCARLDLPQEFTWLWRTSSLWLRFCSAPGTHEVAVQQCVHACSVFLG